MPQMRFAPAAFDFGSPHSVAAIFLGIHRLLFCWRIKTRPTATGIELVFRPEQRLPATDALVSSGCVGAFVFAGIRRLRSLLASDLILIFRQLLLPLRLGLGDLVVRHSCAP